MNPTVVGWYSTNMHWLDRIACFPDTHPFAFNLLAVVAFAALAVGTMHR